MFNWFSEFRKKLFCSVFEKTIEQRNKQRCKRIESSLTFFIPIIVGASPALFPNIGKYYWIEIIGLSALALIINNGLDDVLERIDSLEESERQTNSNAVFTSSLDAAVESVNRYIEKENGDLKKIYDALARAIYRMTTAYCPKYKDINGYNVYVYAVDVKTGLHKRVGKMAGYNGFQSADIHTDWKPKHTTLYYYESNINTGKVSFWESDSAKLQKAIDVSGKGNDELYRSKFSQYVASIFDYGGIVKLYIEVIAFEEARFGKTDEDLQRFITSVISPFSETLSNIDWIKEREACDEAAKSLQSANPKTQE